MTSPRKVRALAFLLFTLCFLLCSVWDLSNPFCCHGLPLHGTSDVPENISFCLRICAPCLASADAG